jgi:hypothetical protein
MRLASSPPVVTPQKFRSLRIHPSNGVFERPNSAKPRCIELHLVEITHLCNPAGPQSATALSRVPFRLIDVQQYPTRETKGKPSGKRRSPTLSRFGAHPRLYPNTPKTQAAAFTNSGSSFTVLLMEFEIKQLCSAFSRMRRALSRSLPCRIASFGLMMTSVI